MKIDNKYNIGDELFCIRNNKIEKVEISNFELHYDTTLSLEERLGYRIKLNENPSFLIIHSYSKNSFKESELFKTIDKLLLSIKENYKNK